MKLSHLQINNQFSKKWIQILLFVIFSYSQVIYAADPNPIPPLTTEDLKAPLPTEQKKPKFKNRKALSIDYNTWFEMLKIVNGTTSSYELKSHYYGIGIGFDYTIYQDNFGLAFNIGILKGTAQTGTQDTSDYYQSRIPWIGARTSGRLFYRFNTRFDLGANLMLQYKQTTWPLVDNQTVYPQTNPQFFVMIDNRLRLNYKYELIQSFGLQTKNSTLVWLFGVNYTLN